jgi:hypothetical protein
MYLHRQSRAKRKKREDFWARCRRRQVERTVREIADYRYWCGFNDFFAECGRSCRRAHACPAADPRACFRFHWDRLAPKDQAFRRDFMDAFVRLRDRTAALREAAGLFWQRHEEEQAGARASAAPLDEYRPPARTQN